MVRQSVLCAEMVETSLDVTGSQLQGFVLVTGTAAERAVLSLQRGGQERFFCLKAGSKHGPQGSGAVAGCLPV